MVHNTSKKTKESCTEIIRSIRKTLPCLEDSIPDTKEEKRAGAIAALLGLSWENSYTEEKYISQQPADKSHISKPEAARQIMELSRSCGKPLPADILEVLHNSLVTGSDEVQYYIAAALFYSGSGKSAEVLLKLLKSKQLSPALRSRAQAALDRIKSPRARSLNIPRIVVILDDLLLVEKLMEMAADTGAVLRHARPKSTDIIQFNGQLKIIDHQLLGHRYWKEFCGHLDADPFRDDTPLIIVDDKMPGNPPDFIIPLTDGKMYYTPVWNGDEICRIAAELLKQRIKDCNFILPG